MKAFFAAAHESVCDAVDGSSTRHVSAMGCFVGDGEKPLYFLRRSECRFWHKADKRTQPPNGRFRGEADIVPRRIMRVLIVLVGAAVTVAFARRYWF
jgi:hypothetical protein